MKLKATLFAGITLLVTGCANNQVQTTAYTPSGPKNPEQLSPDIYPKGALSEPEPVIREGRYRIVSTRPSAEQRDLLAQIIQFHAPHSQSTVKTALNYVTADAGYRLCTAAPGSAIETLYNLPLPKAHQTIGPITLRNALQVLAGPAYQVEINEAQRGICFKVRPDYIEAQVIKGTAANVHSEVNK
ncbi:hypothetical protein [Thiopseudomonas alkaliphila]|uniref:PFGI-1 class ICE element type IV pilus protein PilL2 n=1 Tax=Thiopseudomonas alkaliphila TaxID=1697053 RepID=UPI00069D2357|nr:hypothetical protein [Thiopseudomonas alkaliphila]